MLLFSKRYLQLQCVSWIWILLTLSWWFGFRHKPILGYGQTAQNVVAYVKSVQKWDNNYYLATFAEGKAGLNKY